MATKPATRPPTKSEMIAGIAESTGLSKQEVTKVVDGLVAFALSALKTSGAFKIADLVQLKAVKKPAMPERQGRNPATGAPMTFAAKPARTVVKATPLKAAKETVSTMPAAGQ